MHECSLKRLFNNFIIHAGHGYKSPSINVKFVWLSIYESHTNNTIVSILLAGRHLPSLIPSILP